MTNRAEYFRDYHAWHREERNARNLKRWHALRDKRIQAKAYRRWYEKNKHIVKVARDLGISIPQARAMIKNGGTDQGRA